MSMRTRVLVTGLFRVSLALVTAAAFLAACVSAPYPVGPQTKVAPAPGSPASPSTERPTNIVLIGWDGAQRNHVKECMGKGELPNLKKLATEGTMVDIDVIRTTDTKSGWAQILTGYEPEVTGVFSNSRYGPIPKGYTVFERLEGFFGADKVATVAVIGKKEHVDAGGPKGDTPAKPYYYSKDGMDLFLNGLGVNDNVGNEALELLNQYKDKRFFFFVHFADVDHQGHSSGENSKQYNDALMSCDAWLGKIAAKLKELALYEKTRIYVTADHGFDEGQKSHSDAPYVFLTTNDKEVIRGGTRADIAPTILDRFGLDLGRFQPQLDGESLLREKQGRETP